MTAAHRVTVAAGGLAAVLLLAQVPAVAISSGTAPTDGSTFVNGSAAATAQPFAFAPRDAGLAATVTVGQSIADFRDTLAQASSQALNLGLIGNSLTVQCSALPPALKPDQLPQPLSAESNSGAIHGTKNTAGSQGTAVGQETVSASPRPNEAATADFNGASLGFPGLLSLSGLSSHAYAHLIEGTARVAEATADVGKLNLLGGQIVLSGMHWDISLRSGSHPGVKRSFSLGGASIAGVPLPTSAPSLASTVASINKVLAQTGLHISLPKLTLESGIYGITPLSVGIDNSELGAKLFNPVLNLVHSVIDPAMDAVTKAVCTIGSAYGLINLLLTGVNGVGAIDLELGGATATSDDTTYANPFGNGGLGNGTTATAGTPPATGSGGGGPALGGNGTPPPLPGVTEAPQPDSTPQLAGDREISASCSTTSPAGRPNCSRGAGLAVGLIAIATLGGVAAADYLVSRRRRKLAGMAIET